MKLSDYVVDFFQKKGASHFFLVTGGAVVHLADSVYRNPHTTHVCVQHEESAAAAADGFYRTSGRIGVAMTTSGPGATNLTTSICNAYFDSIPLVCITGQVATFRLRPNTQMRQKGFQETDIETLFQGISKYVKLLRNPNDIRYELEKAFYIAQEGRKGPVILDIPDDLQRAEINPEELRSFDIPMESKKSCASDEMEQLYHLLEQAERPVVIAGAGIRVAKAEKEFRQFVELLNTPVLLTWGGADLLENNHPLNMGCVGVCGPRAGNFAVQNADLVIAVGTRLSQQITGGKQEYFAPQAKKVMIDIDEEELNKFSGFPFSLDIAICSDLLSFFHAFLSRDIERENSFDTWCQLIKSWKNEYPVVAPEEYEEKGLLNPYVALKEISKKAEEDAVIIADTGANICWTMQSFETKSNQLLFSAWNHTPMGYSLPASIGAAFATKRSVISLIGDGGFMMCLQELATISRYQLPVKIFLFDNSGQTTMKQTLEVWLEGRYVGVDRASGLSFPDYKLLAEAFSLQYFHLKDNDLIGDQLEQIWNSNGPVFCRLEIDTKARINPILKFGLSLEDLTPPLEKEEIEKRKQEVKDLHLVHSS